MRQGRKGKGLKDYIVLLDEDKGRKERPEEGCEEKNMGEKGPRVCRAGEWFQEIH